MTGATSGCAQFPMYAAVCGLIYNVGKFMYMQARRRRRRHRSCCQERSPRTPTFWVFTGQFRPSAGPLSLAPLSSRDLFPRSWPHAC